MTRALAVRLVSSVVCLMCLAASLWFDHAAIALNDRAVALTKGDAEKFKVLLEENARLNTQLKSCSGLPLSFPAPAPVRAILNFHFDPVANEFVRDADPPRAASPLPR